MLRGLFCFLLPACYAPAQVLIDTNFAGDYRPVAAHERVHGEMPAGWRDNSTFGRAWIDYSRVAADGRTFLRAAVTKVEDGRCQFNFPLARFDSETWLRLSVALRNPDHLLITMGVRRAGMPYRFAWETTRNFPAGWSEQQFYGRVPRSDADVAFFIVVQGVGTVDLARLRLEKVTMADIRRQVARGEPPAGPKNLARISRFPLGLQSGWALDREFSDGDEVVIAPDLKVAGPSGAAALRIQSQKEMRLFSAPAAIAALTEDHTASLYLRGRGAGRIEALSGLRVLASKRFELAGDEWQRVSVRFSPDLLGKVHGLAIRGAGDFRIDALQIERGAEATAYESQGACEVSLATDSPIRVQFDDEPAQVRYALTGRTEGAVLRARVVNVYGDERTLQPKHGTLDYNVFPARPYGSFRIEAWAEDSAGRRISPYNELVVHRLHKPHYWMKDAPDSPFGIHTLSTTRHILMAKAAGINWTRLHDAGSSYIGWSFLEPRPGEWSFRDEPLFRYRKYGMKILGAFSTAPEWASYFTKPHEAYFDRFYQPRDLDAFANYVRVVAKRYAGVIDVYDLWNEPWSAGYWGVGYDEQRQVFLPSPHGPADFTRLMRTAWQAVKSVDPKITLLGVQTNDGESGTKWTRGVVESGGVPYCDVMCYHQYTVDAPGYPGDAVESGLRHAFEPLLGEDGTAKLPKPVWLTEGSSLNQRIGNGLYRYTLPYAEEEDVIDTSDRLARWVTAALARGVRKVFLYSEHSHNWFGAGSSWRALVTEEGYLHPSAAAYSAMAWFLEDTHIVKTESPAEGVTSFIFRGKGRSVTVLSPAPKHAPYALPAAGFDLFGNPLPKGQPLASHLVYLVARD
jgi:hypothetical protein